MNETNNGNVQAAIEAGQHMAHAAREVILIGGTPHIILPAGMTLNPLEKLRERPFHLEKTVNVSSHSDFVAYWNRFADKDSTIFYDTEKHQFIGVLDYHEDGAGSVDDTDYANTSLNRPRFGLHKVIYNCPKTVEAQRWLNNSGRKMSQMEFAQFIEDGAPEIRDPDSAYMMEVATTLSAVNKVNFQSGVRLQNGAVSLTYQEDIQGSAGANGQLQIPTKIFIGLLLFRGDTEGYKLEANFRYRIEGGKLSLWYELVRSHVALEDAVKAIAKTIKEGIKTGHMIAAVL